MLLTANVLDFESESAPYTVYAPDDFFVLVDDSAPEHVRAAVLQEVAYWLSRGQEPHLPQNLRKAGCPVFAERVRTHLLAIETLPPLFNG